MSDPENTTPEMLMHAADLAKAAGLRYVYAGNIPGRVGDLENTRCHHCSALLIERYGYLVRRYRVTAEGGCPECGTAIPGRWGSQLRRPDRVCSVSARDTTAANAVGADREPCPSPRALSPEPPSPRAEPRAPGPRPLHPPAPCLGPQPPAPARDIALRAR